MDPDIARWVLDFLARQPIGDSTLAALLRTLPLSDTDTNLKKLLLLRKLESEISNGSISVNLLILLEQVEELDYREKLEITESMKRAYCAVAVNCTVRFLVEGDMGKYFEAVKKIWRIRVSEMEKFENVGLVSDELMSWKDDIETAVWDDSVRKCLLGKIGKDVDVFEVVRVYVEEARGKMGPSFLELVDQTLSEDATKQVFGEDAAAKQVIGEETRDIPKGTVQRRSKLRAAKQYKNINSRTSRRGVKIIDNDDLSVVSSQNYGCLSTPEVTKLQEDLRSSTSELQKLVEDPLPDALETAKNVASTMDTVERSAGITHAEKSNLDSKRSSCQTNASKARLLDRNNTARSYEWDDSNDGSAEPSCRPNLPSPKRRVVSPLKKSEEKPLRRRRKFWSNLEEDTLRAGVLKYGRGNWKLILNMYKDIFEDRTEVDLKDKWRNLTS